MNQIVKQKELFDLLAHMKKNRMHFKVSNILREVRREMDQTCSLYEKIIGDYVDPQNPAYSYCMQFGGLLERDTDLQLMTISLFRDGVSNGKIRYPEGWILEALLKSSMGAMAQEWNGRVASFIRYVRTKLDCTSLSFWEVLQDIPVDDPIFSTIENLGNLLELVEPKERKIMYLCYYRYLLKIVSW